jgi:Na+/H+ antiporter NhaD/arsenite permease-like protein
MIRRFSKIFFLIIAVSSLTFAGETEIIPVDPVMILPFIMLLGAIALAPFINKKWWDKNYPAFAVTLGLITVGYYVFILHNGARVLVTGYEYISFIVLIGSLYIVSGGILIQLRGKSTPLNNVILLAIGAVIANIVGTTGASMLLIRPYIKVNKYRIKPFHIIFFIFIVSNVGGALTPIGDPPLFLGYLKGIPFFWITGHVVVIWMVAVTALLAIFYYLDFRNFHRRSEEVQERIEEEGEEAEVKGLQNLGFLLAIIVAVFIEHPIFIRELIMLGAAAGSYYTTSKYVHDKNDFNFHPIIEVAVLFVGIFATMMPALDWLTLNSTKLGVETVGQYYWATGLLSSFLDNAPTYLNFLTASFGLFHLNLEDVHHMEKFLTEHWHYIQSISIGAVFFGACTYIGNGPNFMVKSIAEQNKVEMPSFVEYIYKYTVPILIPLYIVIWFIFF